MRIYLSIALAGSVALLGCSGDGVDQPGTPDAPGGTDAAAACPLDASIADLGTLSALKAQRCNVAGSMGTRKWYRLSATLPGTSDVVQLELYDQAGAFSGSTVHTGSFPIETDFATCGVCLRALGDKGTATAKEYFGTGGMVNITAIGANGASISATITDATLGQVDANHALVSGGCTATIASVQIDGTVMDVGGSGGGGGGGGGTGSCPTTVGD